MSIDLVLGPRPDEPGPPIGGSASYPAEIAERLAADAATIIARYPQPRSALLPLLHLVQGQDGYLTTAGINFCATQLDLTAAEVTAVATFYSMYRRTPTGDYLVGVCTNTLCAVMGGDAILDRLGAHRVQRRLRLRPGGHGQLGVLRQPDALQRSRSRRRSTLRAGRQPDSRCGPAVPVPSDRALPSRLGPARRRQQQTRGTHPRGSARRSRIG